MRESSLLSFRCGLFLALLASGAWAKDFEDRIVVRTLKISDHPASEAAAIYVSGRVVTNLRFESEVNPAKTRLLAWEHPLPV
ncbi:DUF2381 family protein [Pyxidicoccus parkwayensis]|uniref:DUF2381 family protein n=1 Tax=Pyxidicoccus parkwayensis TaxID=2813578 RepID=A0ABX7NYL4_9BACT|nr:DUF2381 family protein [Pyxidicoccus parkwaysis]QSQ23469.1 DUF2381 family protein [Pyxidicoccus parkwaysis]